MWPFKKLPKITFEEYVSSAPMPICGNKVEHYKWDLQSGMPCPMCVAKKQNKQKEIDENRLAEKIAHAVNKITTNGYKEKVSILEAGLKSIFELAYYNNTSPAVPDTLWKIRNLASTTLKNARKHNGKF